MDSYKTVKHQGDRWIISLQTSGLDDISSYDAIIDGLRFLQMVAGRASEPSLKLYTDGCGPSGDCATACSTIDTAFHDPATLYNCMALPLVESLLDNDLIIPSALASAHAMGIRNSSQRTGNENGSPLSTCLSSVEHSVDPSWGVNLTYYNGVAEFYPDICSSLIPELNGDVGGVGIYTSYYIQTGIVIVCFLLIRVFTSWIHWPAHWLRYVKVTRRDPRSVQKSLQGHIPALTTALIDFHKAQCYFMIAAQIAAIVMLQRPSAFDATSYRQLATNYGFLSTISFGGILPVLISLVEIHALDQRSLYMHALSIVVLALSTVVCVTAGIQGTTSTTLVPGPYSTKECCGVYVYKFCSGVYPYGQYTYRLPFARPLLVFTWITHAFLVLDLAAHRLPRFRKIVISQEQQHADEWKFWGAHSFTRGCLVCLLFVYYAGCVCFVSLYINELAGFTGAATMNPKWTFGQIVSLTIWFAPVFEYFYLEIRGMQHGNRYRLREPYVVVNRHDLAGPQQQDRGRSRISALLLRPFGTVSTVDAEQPDTQETRQTRT